MMILYNASKNKKNFEIQVKNEVNCSNCARHTSKGGNCMGYRKNCSIYAPNTGIDWGKF